MKCWQGSSGGKRVCGVLSECSATHGRSPTIIYWEPWINNWTCTKVKGCLTFNPFVDLTPVNCISGAAISCSSRCCQDKYSKKKLENLSLLESYSKKNKYSHIGTWMEFYWKSYLCKEVEMQSSPTHSYFQHTKASSKSKAKLPQQYKQSSATFQWLLTNH